MRSLRWLDEHRSPLFVTCLGLKRTLKRCGLRRVVELDWWDSLAVGATVSPSHRPSTGRTGRCSTCVARCGAAVICGIATVGTVYFAGDTAYAPFFTDIRLRLGAPAVALLPIGAYEPRWFMRDRHMNPHEAVCAHRDLGARTSFAMHFGVFRLTDEGFDDPVLALARARAENSVAADAFRTLDVGESVIVQ